jgi:hypothetical protein
VDPSIERGTVIINSTPVGFETACGAAFRFVSELDALFPGARTYTMASFPSRVLPLVRYVDHPNWEVSYDADEAVLLVTAPWPQVLGSNLLRLCLWHASELARQTRGEYFLHASAVVRDNRAIVLSGPKRFWKDHCRTRPVSESRLPIACEQPSENGASRRPTDCLGGRPKVQLPSEDPRALL